MNLEEEYCKLKKMMIFSNEKKNVDFIAIKINKFDKISEFECKVYYKNITSDIRYMNILAQSNKCFEKKLQDNSINYVPQLVLSTLKSKDKRIDFFLANREKGKIENLVNWLKSGCKYLEKYQKEICYLLNMDGGEKISPLYFIGNAKEQNNNTEIKLYFLTRKCRDSSCIYRKFNYDDKYYYQYLRTTPLFSEYEKLLDIAYNIVLKFSGHFGLIGLDLLKNSKNAKIYVKNDNGFPLRKLNSFLFQYKNIFIGEIKRMMADIEYWAEKRQNMFCEIISLGLREQKVIICYYFRYKK